MGYGLGVDLGTTHTAAAVDHGRVEAFALGSRRAEIPSMLYLHPDGTMLVGEAAERRGEQDPARLARECKRRIGDPVPIMLGGTPFSAHALTARLLHHVVEVVTRAQGAAPDRIVITHPANWGPYKRELLTQAARLADLPAVTLRPEPEAAAVRFASTARVAEGANIAVYDLGGGTFDAAVLRKTARGFEVLGEPSGIEQLGGIDFDEAVVEHVRETLGDDALAALSPDDPEARTAMARLRRDCVEAKEALSFDTEAVIAVALPQLHTRVRMSRAEFESAIRPALADTIAALERALRSARLRAEDLRCVVLAGGSSRIPLVSEMLSATFERPVVLDEQPELGIAMGAALLSGGQAAVTPSPAREAARLAPPTGPSAPTSSPAAPVSLPDPLSAAGASTSALSTSAPAPGLSPPSSASPASSSPAPAPSPAGPGFSAARAP
ncbi:MAG: Hsp70 family protein, partial [Actinoplanes sp.]